MKTRVINYRPLVMVFAGLLMGIYATKEVLIENYFKAVVIFLVGFAVLIFLAVMQELAKKNSKACATNENTTQRKNYGKMYLILFLSIVAGICMILGVVGHGLNTQSQVNLVNGKASLEITARVESVTDDSITIENVLVSGKPLKNIKITLKVLDTQDFSFEVGNQISCTITIFKRNIINVSEGINTSALLKHIYFTGYISSSKVDIEQGSTSIFEKIQIKTDNLLKANMNSGAYGICKALLLGDKTSLDDFSYDSYKFSGLAHVLSVSGLHVGFIVALLGFVLKKLKCNRVITFCINLVFLILYCTLCGFASSVVRASIMSLVILFSVLVNRQQDRLSSLSLAGIVLLLFQPAYALEIGFMLSFGAVFGILLFARPISTLLSKIKLPSLLCDTFAVTLSAEIATLPIIAKYFGYIAPISLISNLVILSLFTVLFCVLFVVFLFNLVFSVGGLYFVMGKLTSGLTSLTTMLSQCAVIKLASLGDLTEGIYYFSLFSISGFVMLKLKVKRCFASALLVVMLVSTIVFNLPTQFKSNNLFVFRDFPNSVLLTSQHNDKVLVGAGTGDEYELESLNKCLTQQKVYRISTLIIPSFNADTQSNIISLVKTYKIKTVYVPQDVSSEAIVALAKLLPQWTILVDYESNVELDFAMVECIKVSGTVKAVKINMNYQSVLVVQNGLTENQASSLTNLVSDVDLIVAEQNYDGIGLLSQYCKDNFKIYLKDISKGVTFGNEQQVSLAQKRWDKFAF